MRDIREERADLYNKFDKFLWAANILFMVITGPLLVYLFLNKPVLYTPPFIDFCLNLLILTMGVWSFSIIIVYAWFKVKLRKIETNRGRSFS